MSDFVVKCAEMWSQIYFYYKYLPRASLINVKLCNFTNMVQFSITRCFYVTKDLWIYKNEIFHAKTSE